MATHVQERRTGTRRRKRRSPWPMLLLVAALILGGFVLFRGVWLGDQAQQPPAEEKPELPQQTEEPEIPVETPDLPELPLEPEIPEEPDPADTPETQEPEEPNFVVVPEEPGEPSEDWRLLLVNKTTPLPEGFTIPELTQLANGHAVDARAYPDLQQMMDDCRAAGFQPRICSSYRSHEKQIKLFNNKMDRLRAAGTPEEELWDRAAEWVAVPGTSEHEGGLALDIVDVSYQLLDDAQENTPAQQWLMAHCQDYGFILRYPKDKTEVTGIGYEPWHYRYVGKEAAQEIMSGGLCLEEYLAR